MKNIKILLLFMLFAISTSCSSEKNGDLVQLYQINGLDIIKLPENFTVTPISSHDSAFGKIENPSDSTFLLFYDIGASAGEYVDSDSKTKKSGTSVNEKFCYEVLDKKYINSNDCCVFITFPENGPANFISLDNQHFDLVMDIMETYQSK